MAPAEAGNNLSTVGSCMEVCARSVLGQQQKRLEFSSKESFPPT